MTHEANNEQLDRKAKKVDLQREEHARSIAGWRDKMGRWRGGLPGFTGTFQVLLQVFGLLGIYPLPLFPLN